MSFRGGYGSPRPPSRPSSILDADLEHLERLKEASLIQSRPSSRPSSSSGRETPRSARLLGRLEPLDVGAGAGAGAGGFAPSSLASQFSAAAATAELDALAAASSLPLLSRPPSGGSRAAALPSLRPHTPKQRKVEEVRERTQQLLASAAGSGSSPASVSTVGAALRRAQRASLQQHQQFGTGEGLRVDGMGMGGGGVPGYGSRTAVDPLLLAGAAAPPSSSSYAASASSSSALPRRPPSGPSSRVPSASALLAAAAPAPSATTRPAVPLFKAAPAPAPAPSPPSASPSSSASAAARAASVPAPREREAERKEAARPVVSAAAADEEEEAEEEEEVTPKGPIKYMDVTLVDEADDAHEARVAAEKAAAAAAASASRQRAADLDASLPSMSAFSRASFVNEINGVKEGNEGYGLAYSHDSAFLSVACGDGSIRVYDASNHRLFCHLNVPTVDQMPATCVRFRPPMAAVGEEDAQAALARQLILAATADGTITLWSMRSRTRKAEIVEEKNEVYVVEYRPDGNQFLSAGLDGKLRLYDAFRHSHLATLSTGRSSNVPGHTSRVYAAKYAPVAADGSSFVIVSGGWDNTMQIWDTRVGHAVRSIYGPHICGESLDIHPDGKTLLTGSWRAERALQPDDPDAHPEMLYAACFSPSGNLIAAGGAGGINEANIFETSSLRRIDRVSTVSKGIYSMAFSPDGKKLAIAGGDPIIQVLDMSSRA